MSATLLRDRIASLPLVVYIAILAVLSLPLRIDATPPDVSWLIDMCSRILAGETAYIDIFETTPPIPMLLYMPGAMAEAFFGLQAETIVYIYCYAFFAFCLLWTDRLAPKTLPNDGLTRWQLILPAAFFFFFLTSDAFAQREAIAAAAMLPIAAIAIRFAQTGEWPDWRTACLVGALAGFGAAVKPPIFALPLLILGGYLLLRTRQFRVLFDSGLIASGIVAVGVTVASLIAYPAYMDGVATLMRDVYVPARMNPTVLIVFSVLSIAGIIKLAFEKPSAWVILGLFCLSFVIVFFVQGKLFPYHGLPAFLFSFLLLTTSMPIKDMIKPEAIKSKKEVASLAVISGAVLGVAYFINGVFQEKDYSFDDMTWAETLDRPTALGITPSIFISFPLAREFDAQWIDRIHGQWVIHYAHIITKQPGVSPETIETYERYKKSEVERLTTLIKTEKPEIIIHCLFEGAKYLTETLLAHSPDLLDDYEPIAQENGIQILRLRSAIADSEALQQQAVLTQ